MKRTLRPPLVAPERAAEIVQFGKELQSLCAKYGLEICASQNSDVIEVYDLRREIGEYIRQFGLHPATITEPGDYEYDALLKGCNGPDGVFYIADTGEAVPCDVEIAEWLPEDRWARKSDKVTAASDSK
jgi:hypothetical protein